MAFTALKRFSESLSAVVTLSLLLLVSLYLLSSAIDNSTKFDEQYVTLLFINLGGLAMLLLLIGANIYRLIKHHRQGVAGSRLTTRMLTMFIIIAILPVCVVYYFSLDFLNRGIDSWFDVSIERALDDALELSRASMDTRLREALKQTTQFADELADAADSVALLSLSRMRESSGAREMTLFGATQVIASSHSVLSISNPERPSDAILSRVREAGSYASVDPSTDTDLSIRVVVKVASQDPTARDKILQARYPVTERINTLAENVQSAFAKYKRLVYLRDHLKFSFLLTLSLVLLLTILTAVWASLFSVRRLTAPIRDLAEGTRAVAAGDYSTRLPVSGNDELSFLVESFNEMTRRVQRASDQVTSSKAAAEAQRAYLETILGRLSSGVLSINSDGLIRTVNRSASLILGTDLRRAIDLRYTDLPDANQTLTQFFESIDEFLMTNNEWRKEVTVFGADGRLVLMCRGAPLHNGAGQQNGDVIVFDDITALLQAQRDAAWGEVARRLAHEIKNPLTPIQLATERLRHKYLKKLTGEDADLLDRATHTITQQVETMKEMVNAFSEYARAPQLHLQPVDINATIREVIDLYQADPEVTLHVDLDESLPRIDADNNRLRQLLNNLIKNAKEARKDSTHIRIDIRTRCVVEEHCRFIELDIQDDGPGFSEAMLPQLFEPYVTNKAKGTGLGLAIVKKIVEEHGGIIRAENAADTGALLSIRLPVLNP